MIYLLALIIMTPILSVVITIIRWKQRQHLNLKKLNSTLRLKNCLVTGSSTGLGRDLGREIVRAGGTLILISRGKTMSKNINATGMASETMTKTLATNTAMTELEETRIELEKEKIYEDQVVESYCCDLGDYDQVSNLCQLLRD